MTDKYLSYIFFTCYIPLKHKYESYDIKGDLTLSLDLKKIHLIPDITLSFVRWSGNYMRILEWRVSNV